VNLNSAFKSLEPPPPHLPRKESQLAKSFNSNLALANFCTFINSLDLYIDSMNERKEYCDGKNPWWRTERVFLHRQCKGNLLQKHFLQRCTSANPTASRMQGLRMSRWYNPSVVYGVGTSRRYRMIERGGYNVVFDLLLRSQYSHIYTVKKVSDFPVPSRDVTNQTLSGGEQFNYSRPGRVWLVTSQLGTGKSLAFFDSDIPCYLPRRRLQKGPPTHTQKVVVCVLADAI
jgi:hypothetical protein